ncbi:hypothetical protein V500_04905 [Pseudogymnoascus sp. VKM F-4518 (FW-2643)]|nr:hypothetical protein V500_04905 [Pseudogymnoascus sp. VKM F-4518 (FW-2643)]
MSAPSHSNPSPTEATAGSVASPSPSSDEHRDGHGHKARFRTMTFPRKRAVTACDTCRSKKTKCGNERPICASCTKHGWPCSFDPRLDHASFDPASLLILDKLNQTLEKLTEVDREVKGQTAAATRTSPSCGHGHSHRHGAPPSPSDCLEVPTAFGSSETILTWPIFNGRWSRNFLSQEILIGSLSSGSDAQGDHHQYHHHRNPLKGGVKRASQGINEENVPGLVDRFLQLVHSKNPVLNTRQIREAARHVAEDGVGWDASSCIVLLACALGAVARPFNPSSEVGLLSGRTSLDDTFDLLETGDAFYQVARKRLGLLNQSIMAGQCHMLSGIYLMYTLHPLDAWSAFHHAGSVYSLYLRSQAALQERCSNGGVNVDASPSHSTLEKRLEQRLYWTVLKLDYPFLFPSPPTPGSPAAESPEDHQGQGPASAASTSTSSQLLSLAASTSTCASQSAEEQTWFYYLSEIALRRIENRILNAFYKEDHQHWLQMDLAIMVSAAEEIEAQMESWYASLPTSIRFDNNSDSDHPHQAPASDELSYMTKGRSLQIHSLLYRPFLYYAIHAQAHRWNPTTSLALQGFVQKSLANCLAVNAGNAMAHRHHGTWYALRESATTALMLLAARAADLINTTTVEGLNDNQQYARPLQICVERLRYWEAEAPPDVARAREIIEELMSAADIDRNYY